jgi:hypothetical protein
MVALALRCVNPTVDAGGLGQVGVKLGAMQEPAHEQPSGPLEQLLADLDSEFGALERVQDERAAVEALRARLGETPLWEQIARRVDHEVTVRFGDTALAGVVVAGYSDFFALRVEAEEHLVRLGPQVSVAFPARSTRPLSPAPTGLARCFTLMLALRELARRREPVRVRLADGNLATGTIEAVGRDYLELAEHDPGEARRTTAVRARRFVGLAAVVLVSPLLPAR